METFMFILVILAVLAGLTLLGFAIVLIVGFSTKKDTPKKVGKLGSIISGSILAISLVAFFITQKSYNDNQARIEEEQIAETEKMDKKFRKVSDEFLDLATEAVTTGEDVASNIHDGWGEAIDNSSGSDFDVDKTIAELVVENADDIDSMSEDLDKMKELLSAIKKNDAGTYELDSDFYSKMYDHVSDYVDFVSYPSGSYLDFVDEVNDYHQKITKDIKKLQ